MRAASRNVVPHAKQRAGYGDDRGCGKNARPPMPHPNRNSAYRLRWRAFFCASYGSLQIFGCEKAEQVADGVVQHHDTENQQSALNDFAFARADDRTDNQHNGNDRNQRQGSGSAFGLFAEHSMCNHAERDGQQHHLNNGNKHRLRIDVEHFTCQKQENSRRQQRSQQGGSRCNCDGQGNVAARQKSHHIGSRTARTATDQNHAHSNFSRQI